MQFLTNHELRIGYWAGEYFGGNFQVAKGAVTILLLPARGLSHNRIFSCRAPCGMPAIKPLRRMCVRIWNETELVTATTVWGGSSGNGFWMQRSDMDIHLFGPC